jgi:hypothetical protein
VGFTESESDVKKQLNKKKVLFFNFAGGLVTDNTATPVSLNLPYPVAHVVVGDVNGDGLVDVVSDDQEGVRIVAAYGSGDGFFHLGSAVTASLPLSEIMTGYTGSAPVVHAIAEAAAKLTTWKTTCSRRRATRLQ